MIPVLDLCNNRGVVFGSLSELVLQLHHRNLLSFQLLQSLLQFLMTDLRSSLKILPAIFSHEEPMLVLLILQLVTFQLAPQPDYLLLVVFHVVIEQLDLQFLLVV